MEEKAQNQPERTQTTGFHGFKFDGRGIILEITQGKSTSMGTSYANILIESRGKKYTETIPMVAYGPVADSLIQRKIKEGDTVIVHGRIRSKSRPDRVFSVLVCEQVMVIRED